MVAFSSSAVDLFAAAGIFEEWLNSETGELLESFSIITTSPCKQIENMGHDRQPVFLDPAGYDSWINGGKKEANHLKDILSQHLLDLEFTPRKFRALKPGWEKRK